MDSVKNARRSWKKWLIVVIIVIIGLFILQIEYDDKHNTEFYGDGELGEYYKEVCSFNGSETIYDLSVQVSGNLMNGEVYIDILDGVFDFEDEYTREDIIKTVTVDEIGSFEEKIYVGDINHDNKRTVIVRCSEDIKGNNLRIKIFNRRRVYQNILDFIKGLFL